MVGGYPTCPGQDKNARTLRDRDFRMAGGGAFHDGEGAPAMGKELALPSVGALTSEFMPISGVPIPRDSVRMEGGREVAGVAPLARKAYGIGSEPARGSARSGPSQSKEDHAV